MNLNQVTLPVKDLEAANEFYIRLGFTQIVDSVDYARFECPEGTSTFSLYLEKGQFLNGAIIYFEHQHLDHWVAQLKSRGIAFEQDPTDQDHLWREALIRDPSGNQIILYWAGENRLHPPWRVNKRRS